MTRRLVPPGLVAACALAPLLVTLPGVGEGAAEAAEIGQEHEWDRFMKVVLGFSDLVGRISSRKLTFRKLPPATNASGQVRITRKGWRFENVTADICGGRLAVEAAIDFLPDMRRLRIEGRADGVELEDLTRLYDYSVMKGFVSGSFELSVSSVKGTLHGRAEMHVRNADLGRLPFALKAVSFIFLGFPKLQEEKISQADAHITMTPGGLVFQHLSLRSDAGTFSIEAERNGTISYKGDINLYFRPVFEEGFTKVVPGLPEIINTIRGRGGRVRVTGTIHDPKFNWGAFR